MPCYDSRADDEARENDVKLRKLEAVLCAIFMAIDRDEILNLVDFSKVGISKQWVEDWHAPHQRRDQDR
jgi:hypothetical protein